MLTMFIRAAILYGLVVVIMRAMGKRQISQLQPYELVVTIMIADLASSPMEDASAPILYGIMPIVSLVLMQSLFSLVSLKSGKLRNLINGQPSVLLKSGIIDQKEMTRQGITLSELLEEIRTAGINSIEDVGCVVLEVSGDMSIFPTAQKRPLTPSDMDISTGYEGLSLPLVLDGNIQSSMLEKGHLTQGWLEKHLARESLTPNEVLLCMLDTRGILSIQAKDSLKLITHRVLDPQEVTW